MQSISPQCNKAGNPKDKNLQKFHAAVDIVIKSEREQINDLLMQFKNLENKNEPNLHPVNGKFKNMTEINKVETD